MPVVSWAVSVGVLQEWVVGSVLATPWVPVDMVKVSDWQLSRLMMVSYWGALLLAPIVGDYFGSCGNHTSWETFIGYPGSNDFRSLAMSVAGRHFVTF